MPHVCVLFFFHVEVLIVCRPGLKALTLSSEAYPIESPQSSLYPAGMSSNSARTGLPHVPSAPCAQVAKPAL